MSTQIAIRLPDEIVQFVDAQVASGAAKSRADFIWHAIDREQRRIVAIQDAAIYASIRPEDEEFAGLAELAAHQSFPELD